MNINKMLWSNKYFNDIAKIAMKQQNLNNEYELFQQLALGDENAFEKIFHHYFPFIVSFIIKITHTQHTAEEIAQEVFLRLWKHREEFQQKSGLRAWLYKVAANLAFDHLKKEAHHNKLILFYNQRPGDYDDTSNIIAFKESKLIIEAVVQKLPEQQKLAYKLSREDGLNHQEIADKMNISINTVKNHISKALQKIKHAVNNAAHLFISAFFWRKRRHSNLNFF